MNKYLLPWLLFLFFTGFLSCKKESYINSPEARLSTSVDTVKFDTVFTSVGSISKSFKIFNNNAQKLRLSSVKLMGGAASPFKINVNGMAAVQLDDINIAANDSIYIFVTVSVNPGAANLPYLLTDSIQVIFNGNTRFIQLEAYGQNATFLKNITLTSDTTFTKNQPYVILGVLKVSSGVTVTFEAGARLFFHANAGVLVEGSLVSTGTLDEPVICTGDRLDEPYNKFPASWTGISFSPGSRDNNLTYTIIKNASQALVVLKPAASGNPKLVLHQCTIYNAKDAALLCEGSNVAADNCLFYNSGSDLVVKNGGTYSFTNCTLAGYSNNYLSHTAPVAKLANFLDMNGVFTSNALTALFKNCIFWGENGIVENEITVEKEGAASCAVTLDHCLYKASTDPLNSSILSSIKNLDPEFDSIDVRNNFYNFRITKSSLSPVISAGTPSTFLRDLDFFTRNPVKPDIGSYEKH